ncbi:hypothetical protein C0995_011456 [Termitomyces sp. Mi166|nr:hypothetical protein C0995_011456 [Termitomyces sp. Mi166\
MWRKPHHNSVQRRQITQGARPSAKHDSGSTSATQPARPSPRHDSGSISGPPAVPTALQSRAPVRNSIMRASHISGPPLSAEILRLNLQARKKGLTLNQPPAAPRPATSEPPLPPLLPSPSPSTSPPLKRRRVGRPRPSPIAITSIPEVKTEIEHDDITIFQHKPLRSPSPQTQTQIKAEDRSPSPILPTRKLITHACAFYPLPENCRKTNANAEWMKHRHALIARERAVLRERGLRAMNVLFRDDGMVVEWTSPVPVWSDTLLPEPEPESPNSGLTDKYRSLRPRPLPKPAPKRRREESEEESDDSSTPSNGAGAPTSPIRLPLPEHRMRAADQDVSHSPSPPPPPPAKDKGKAKEVITPPPRPRPRPLPKPLPRSRPRAEALDPFDVDVAMHDAPHAHEWTPEEMDQVEPMALDFLDRYIKAFDTSLTALTSAYAPHALFSYRFSPSSPSSSPFSLSSSPTTPTLHTLAPLASFKFLPSRATSRTVQFHYDVAPLDAAAVGGAWSVLMSVHGEVVEVSSSGGDAREDRVWGLDQAFVLQRSGSRRRFGDEERAGEGEGGEWPLVAVSHQMVFRRLEGRGVTSWEEFEWLK